MSAAPKCCQIRTGTVTKLSYLRNGGVRVYIDEAEAVVVDATTLQQLQLKRGRQVDERMLPLLRHAADRFEAHKRAINSLALRSFSQRELQRRLTDKGVTPQAAQEAVAHYAALGLIDDRDYAGQRAESMQRKGYGRHRILRELMQRGIGRPLCEDVIATLPPDCETIDAHLSNRFSAVDWSDHVQRRRAFGALMRLGFSYEDITSALWRLREFDESEE